MTYTFQFSKSALLLSALIVVSGCSSTKPKDGDRYNAVRGAGVTAPDQDVAGFVKASDFLPRDLMSSPFHLVADKAYNDGFANAYEIESKDYIFVVQGTEQAIKRIYEIEATERARDISLVKTAGGTALKKTGNFIATPYRFLKAGVKRTKKVDSTKDALLLVPSGVGEIMGKVGGGLFEMGKTGVGVAKDGVDAARGDGDGERCGLTDCMRSAGGTVKSTFESVTGTKGRARRLHQKLGTDPYTDNHLLQKQVGRVAYSESLTSAGFSVGLGFIPVSAFAAYSTGVGYANNAEYVLQYTDPDARREQERGRLASWGSPADVIEKLYANEAYTPTTRTQLVQALAKVNSARQRVNILRSVAPMSSRYLVDVQLRSLRHMVQLQQAGGTILTSTDDTFVYVRDGRGTDVLTIAADYVQWTPLIIDYVRDFAAMSASGTRQLHVLGTASPTFKKQAAALGVMLIEKPARF